MLGSSSTIKTLPLGLELVCAESESVTVILSTLIPGERFHLIGFHFDRGRPPDQLHGEHHAKAAGMTHENPGQICEWTGFDPHLLADGGIGVRSYIARLQAGA